MKEYQMSMFVSDWQTHLQLYDFPTDEDAILQLQLFWEGNNKDVDPTGIPIAYLDNESTQNSFDQIPIAIYCEVGLITDRQLIGKIMDRAFNGELV